MNIKTEEAKLREEIKKVKEAQEVFRKQPEVRGGMTDHPNIEDVKRWKEWYKKWVDFRKQNLDSDVLEAKLQQLLADKKMFQDAVEKLRIKSIKTISKNMNVEPNALCQFGNLGLMTVEDLVNTFYGKELLKTLGIQEKE